MLHIFRLATEYWNLWCSASKRAQTYGYISFDSLQSTETMGHRLVSFVGESYISFDSLQSTETDGIKVIKQQGISYISFDSLQSTETQHSLWVGVNSLWLHIFRLATEYWNIMAQGHAKAQMQLHIFRLATEYWNTQSDLLCHRQTGYISFDSLQSTETHWW